MTTGPQGWLCCAAMGVGALGFLGCSKTEVVEGFPDSFVGVGLELTITNGVPVVVRAIEKGPAALAGVVAGDRIIEVDNKATGGKSLGDVVMLLRGPPDSQVTLAIDRGASRVLVVVRRVKLDKAAGDYKAER